MYISRHWVICPFTSSWYVLWFSISSAFFLGVNNICIVACAFCSFLPSELNMDPNLFLLFLLCFRKNHIWTLLPIGYAKNQLDVTGIDVYSRKVNSTCFEHHYADRQENRLYKKLCLVNALLCWLQSCRFGTRAVCIVWKMVYDSVFCIVCSPDDEHNDARNMLS